MSLFFKPSAGGGGGGPATIDNFEDGNIDEYGGATGDFATQTGTVYDGTYALENSGTYFNKIQTTASSGDLDNYPSQGDKFEWYVRVSAQTNTGTSVYAQYGTQDADNTYRFKLVLSSGDGHIQLERREGGGNTVILDAQDVISPAANTWFRCQVEWDDGSSFGGSAGDHNCYVEEVGNTSNSGSGSVNDTKWSSGEWGWVGDLGSDGKSAFHDQARIL
jgi:hypothetical protein